MKKRLPALQLGAELWVEVYRHQVHYFSQHTNGKLSSEVVTWWSMVNERIFFSHSLFKI